VLTEMKMRALTAGWRAWALVLLQLLAVSAVDFAIGHQYGIFVFYFVPVAFAAWARGLTPAALVSVVSSVLWVADELHDRGAADGLSVTLWNCAIRLGSFLIVAWTFSVISRSLARERMHTQELRDALAKVRVLEGLLPICASCKKIRNEAGEWDLPEVYIHQRTDAEFTHSYCPDCAARLIEEYERERPAAAARRRG
jgi:hypothetical protein